MRIELMYNCMIHGAHITFNCTILIMYSNSNYVSLDSCDNIIIALKIFLSHISENKNMYEICIAIMNTFMYNHLPQIGLVTNNLQENKISFIGTCLIFINLAAVSSTTVHNKVFLQQAGSQDQLISSFS